MKRLLFILLALCLIISSLGIYTYYDAQGYILVSNETVNVTVDNTTKIIDQRFDAESNITVITVIQGKSDITDALSAKLLSKETVLKQATSEALKDVEYPYRVADSELTIEKFKCDEEMQLCGYYVSCIRDGREVYTNSPVWISPPPYEVFVSSSFDENTFTSTVILKEDPKEAVEIALGFYCDNQPLGKAVSYER
ncbi:MAG: hypothetical protein M0Q91_05545 [Methanoregula sp.]|jgi:hypothetical protein|nr:hypothetical protein [Methanoregula sp.]